MAIPNYKQVMVPVLRLVSDGIPEPRRELASAVAEVCALTDDERHQLTPSGKQPVILSRVGLALSYLKQARLVDRPARDMH